jgi:hypothetical protein
VVTELAKNLKQAICDEWWSEDRPDQSYNFMGRTNALCQAIPIENRFFMECLWWGVNHHQVDYVLTYFEVKVELAEKENSIYHVSSDDFLYFKNGIPKKTEA